MQGAVVYLTTHLWRLAAVNLFGLALAVLGLGLFGLAPALVACLWATARLDRDAGELVAGMWAQMRREGVRANLLALPQAAALTGTLWMAGGAQGAALTLWLLAAVGLAMHLLAMLVVLSRYDASARDTLANSRAALALAPMRHLLLLPALGITVAAAIAQPPLGLWFGLSAPALVVNLTLLPALVRAPTPETPT